MMNVGQASHPQCDLTSINNSQSNIQKIKILKNYLAGCDQSSRSKLKELITFLTLHYSYSTCPNFKINISRDRLASYISELSNAVHIVDILNNQDFMSFFCKSSVDSGWFSFSYQYMKSVSDFEQLFIDTAFRTSVINTMDQITCGTVEELSLAFLTMIDSLAISVEFNKKHFISVDLELLKLGQVTFIFKDCGFANMSFSNDANQIHLYGGTFIECNFEYYSLRSESNADFRFVKCNLQWTTFNNIPLASYSFTDSNLTDASFKGTQIGTATARDILDFNCKNPAHKVSFAGVTISDHWVFNGDIYYKGNVLAGVPINFIGENLEGATLYCVPIASLAGSKLTGIRFYMKDETTGEVNGGMTESRYQTTLTFQNIQDCIAGGILPHANSFLHTQYPFKARLLLCNKILNEFDLEGMDIKGFNFAEYKFVGCDFSKAILDEAMSFAGALFSVFVFRTLLMNPRIKEIRDICVSQCSVGGYVFVAPYGKDDCPIETNGVALINCDLGGIRLDLVKFNNNKVDAHTLIHILNWNRANDKGYQVLLKNLDLTQVDFTDLDLSENDLRDVDFKALNLSKMSLKNAIISASQKEIISKFNKIQSNPNLKAIDLDFAIIMLEDDLSMNSELNRHFDEFEFNLQ